MDNLTHALTGAALAAAGLDRRTPLATATLVLAANLPDVDAVTYFLGEDLALYWRRGWTHGVLALAVLPLLLAVAVLAYDRFWRRRRRPDAAPTRPREVVLLAYLGCLTHPLLDWLNTYGIRLLMPFDGTWLYGDQVFIVDPWLWLVLGGTVFLARSRRRASLVGWAALALVTTLIVWAGAPALLHRLAWIAGLALVVLARLAWPPGGEGARRWARGGLAAAVLYVALLGAGSALAAGEIRAALAARGEGPIVDLMVGPVAASPWRRDVIAVLPERYVFGAYGWLERPRFRVTGERPLPLAAAPAETVAAAFAAPCARGMVGWMRYPMVEVETRDGGGYDVYLLDARYSRERRRGFGASHVRLTDELEVVE